jgi:hypothetical protein
MDKGRKAERIQTYWANRPISETRSQNQLDL